MKGLIKTIEERPAAAILVGVSVLAGVAFARSIASRDDSRRLSDTLARTAQDGLQNASRIAGQFMDTGAEQLERGLERGADRLSDLPRPTLPDMPDLPDMPSLPHRHQPVHQRALSKMGIQEKTVAVFMGTLLAKSISGYIRWQAEKDARAKGAAIASDDLTDDTPLEEQTVAELRRQASEQEIDGRSGMNKDELVDALKEA